MSARDDAVEAGARALHGDECPDDEHDMCDVGAWDRAAATVVDAVIPILTQQSADDFVAACVERLRAQVEVMRPAGFVHGDDPGNDLLRRSHVLALLGGAQ